jgi:hypothetical protein
MTGLSRQRSIQQKLPTPAYCSSVLCPFLKEKKKSQWRLREKFGQLTFSFLIWACREGAGGLVRKKGGREMETDLLFRREVVDDVEEFTNLLRGLAFNHVCNGLATDIAVAQLTGKKDNKKGRRTAEI